MWMWSRALRIADGPDEVHLRTIARRELRRAGTNTSSSSCSTSASVVSKLWIETHLTTVIQLLLLSDYTEKSDVGERCPLPFPSLTSISPPTLSSPAFPVMKLENDIPFSKTVWDSDGVGTHSHSLTASAAHVDVAAEFHVWCVLPLPSVTIACRFRLWFW